MMSANYQQQQPNNKKATVSATDEFWNTPISRDLPYSDDFSAKSDDDMELYLPPAHHQLIGLYDHPTYENLKGYDHTRSVISNGNIDGNDTDDLFRDMGSSFCCRRRQTRLSVSDVKQQGGGSWLMGFARIRDESADAASTQEATPPGLVRVPSASSFDSDDSSSDEESTASSLPSKPQSRGVSFSPSVKVQPVPHSSDLTPFQRRKMYSSSFEVRQNKIRNKKEYRYDGYDWRNITEEWEMGVDMVTGELIHPAHDHI